MIRALILACATTLLSPCAIAAKVKGHVTKKGTYVSPHTRTNPDSSRTNNYSSKPNVNPYTGKRGTVDPYAPKPARQR